MLDEKAEKAVPSFDSRESTARLTHDTSTVGFGLAVGV